MKLHLRNPVHQVALIRRYNLIQFTRWIRVWEKRPLTQRKREVLLLFGSLFLVLLANLSQQLKPSPASAKEYSPARPGDSTAQHQLYMNELHTHKLTPTR
ncbi:hypothetical protein [Spirosoma luteum]|uniref:hypothetical protein n=1 Tax=Spirosoma luteum TaxID=431553 RepID=UPI00035F54DD|nr:hypothetical protein [Spirosoma luteum]